MSEVSRIDETIIQSEWSEKEKFLGTFKGCTEKRSSQNREVGIARKIRPGSRIQCNEN